jgi:thiol:disulfide interchange protein DsbD
VHVSQLFRASLKALLASSLLAPMAWAGGTSSPPPPAPPKADFSLVPDAASVRSTGADGKPHPVHARLLTDATVPAGTTGRVGLHLEQDEGWHTYWKSPGAIGQPTDIVWTLPDGISVADHAYPVPQRFEDTGMVSFGYDGEVLLIAPITVDATVAPGTYPVKAEASWLVCKTSCIPGGATLTAKLTVSDPGSDAVASSFRPLFDHYAKQHPTDPLTVKQLSWDVALDPQTLVPNTPFRAAFLLKAAQGKRFDDVPATAWPTFTPIATSYDWMLAEQPVKVHKLADDELLVLVSGEAFEPDPLPTTDRIGGLVQVKVDGEWVRTEIGAGLPWSTEAKASTSPLFDKVPAEERGAVVPTATEGGGDDELPPPPPPGSASPTVDVVGATAVATQVTMVTLLTNLFLAFVGGLILNIMPCVLPVLMLKLYSLVEQADITAGERRTAGGAYTVGILVSFWVLAGAVVALRAIFDVDASSWGFQFQYPPYVAALATIVFAFGLSLFGVFEIPAVGADAAGEVSSKEGPVGYFFTGVFATLLATPCSAPILGAATAYAFAAPTPVLIAIFTFIGLGLAAPFLAIAFVPAAFKLLPHPGAWMDGFKQLLGFSLIVTTVWLVDVLMAQIGVDRTTGFLFFLTAVAFGCWVFGRWGGLEATRGAQLGSAAVGLAISGVAGAAFLDLDYDDTVCDDGAVVQADALDFAHEIPWQPFSEQRVAQLAGNVVFIDFTAEWCLTCKANEKTILETQSVRQAMAERGVVPLKADWTRRDPVITEWLRRYQRAGVPMYLVLPKDPSAQPIVLPEVITAGLVLDALDQAHGPTG